MPPISPVKDAATGKTVKSATLTPLRTMSLEEVYKLITSNERLATLTLAVRDAALRGDENACRRLKQQTLRSIHPPPERLPDGAVGTGGGGHRPPRIGRGSRKSKTTAIRRLLS